MRKTEESALEEFRLTGWSPIRNGWPDYLLVRSTHDGKLEFMGLEVKCEGDNLTDEQRAMHVVLLSAGIKVVVRKVARPVVPKVTPTD
jgi:hypothetical protein